MSSHRQPLARRYPSLGLLLCLMVCLTLVNACAVGPDFARPEPPPIQRYTYERQPEGTIKADGLEQHFESGASISEDWWRLFKSDSMNAAVSQALAHNPTLQASEASLRQSQDLLRAGQGIFYPRVDASLNAVRSQSSPLQQGVTVPTGIFNLITPSVNVSYALDVFGSERRTVEGLKAQVESQRYIGKAAYLTLSADVVNACIARAGYSAQIEATEALIALEIEQLHSIESQVKSGTSAYVNLLSQRSQIASNQALLAPLKQKISQTDHLLALLQGTTPDQVAPLEVSLSSLTLPLSIPVSLPSTLVRQRPDILNAQALLHVASANIGVATAAEFPSFSLNANYSSVVAQNHGEFLQISLPLSLQYGNG